MNLSVVIYSIILWSWATEAHLLAKRAVDCPKITDFSGRVKYRRKGLRAIFRCPKTFQRHGQRAANCLANGTWDTESPLCVKDGCLPLDASKVYNLDMDVQRGVVTFQCLEHYVLVGESLIHCNGQTWSAQLPRCAAPHELTECDFEVDLCGWIQDDTDQIDWIRNSGITPTGDTGPKHDHTHMTERSGHYMFFETSTPTETGDAAVLKSPSYPKSLSPICFDFWYHMEGPDNIGHVGDLDVYVIDESEFIDDDGVHPLLALSGNQGSEWKRGEIDIEEQDESFQIVIVATKRISYISDIAIDDVRLFNCTDNSTIGVTTAKQSSTKPTTTTSIPTSLAISTPTSSIPSTAPTKSVTAPRETTEQPTTVVSTPAPSTPAPSTQVPTKPTKQTTTAPTTRTTERTTTTKSTTTSTTLRPTTLKQTTPEPTTTRTTRRTTATRTMAATTTSTLAPTTAAPPPTTTTAKIYPTVASTTRTPVPVSTKRSTSRATTSKTKSSTLISTTVLASSAPSSKTTKTTSISVTSSPITNRAPSTNKTSAASSPKVTTTIRKPTQTPSNGTPTPKTTKRSNSITTKAPTDGNTTKVNAISVAEHDTLKPLMIGLGVGIVAGLIIIGVIAYVCVRRRKFYTSRYEDELKPITHAASNQSLNDDHFYKDEEYESES